MFAAAPLAGCAVGQPPGKGEVLHMNEPLTGGWYYLYLPEDYVKTNHGRLTGNRWPLVVTFHGMKPFDNAKSQIREWQQEADRYGFIVIAPQLSSPDLVKQFPLRTVHPGVVRDEKLTIAAMDDVIRRTDADPRYVLSTSWSSGGYLAHYLANQYPERFSCVAVRQSNFSSAVLDDRQVPLYRGHKIGIFFTENDIAICRRESLEGAKWYHRHGFDVTFAMFKGLGHERRPGVAAAFFARTCGATAKTPPTEIARMQVVNVPLTAVNETPATDAIAQSAPSNANPPRDVALATGTSKGQSATARPNRPRQRAGVTRNGRSGPVPLSLRPLPPQQRSSPTPEEPQVVEMGDEEQDANEPLRVRVSSSIGISPMLVSFSAIVPQDLRRGSYFLWTDNGEPISNGMNGQKYLTSPGQHRVEVIMTTADGRTFRADKTITVLERIQVNERAQ